MHAAGFWGCIIQFLGPIAILLFTWLRVNPQLLLFVLYGAFFCLAPVLLNSIIFVSVNGLDVKTSSERMDNTTNSADQYKVMYAILAIVFQEIFRLLCCFTVTRAENFFREQSQVIHASRFRTLQIGAAIGVGFGMMLTLLQAVVMIEAHNEVSSNGAILYRLDVCPQLPFLYFVTLQHCFYFVAQILWTSMTLAAVFGIFGFSQRRSTSRRTSALDAATSREGGTHVGAEAGDRRDSLDDMDRIVPGDGGAQKSTGQMGSEMTEVHPSSSTPSDRPPSASTRRFSPVSIPSSSSLRPSEAIVLLVLVWCLHTIFVLVYLSTDAYDYSTASPRSSKGCVVSLPVSAVTLVVSLLLALAVAKAEVLKRINLDDL